MEWLLALLYEWIVVRVDSLLQKSLHRAIPDFDRLLADPAGRLAAGDIVIGPERRYASAVLFALVMSFLLLVLAVGAFLVVILVFMPGAALPPGAAWLGAFGLSILVSVAYTVWRFRGGRCVLSRDGVRFWFGNTAVVCPWALFSATGRPVLSLDDRSGRFVRRFVLPVWPAAVPYVEARRDGGLLIAQGIHVKTRQLTFLSANEAECRASYVVHAEELAGLLLHLGSILGGALPNHGVPVADLLETAARVSPAVRLDNEGWVTLSLARLKLPPVCCDCGRATGTVQPFSARSSLFQMGRYVKVEGQQSPTVWLPLCDACLDAWERRCRKAGWNWLALSGLTLLAGGGGAIALGTVVGGDWVWVSIGGMVLIVLALPGALFARLVGGALAEKRSSPVELERYSPRNGTVAIRFRRPGYADRVVAAMAPSTDLV
jgi:hypothetical protein